MENMMKPKVLSAYLMRRNSAATQLETIQNKMEPYVDIFLEQAADEKLNLKQIKEMDKLGVQVNKLRTDLHFFENQIGSSGLYEIVSDHEHFLIQKFNLN